MGFKLVRGIWRAQLLKEGHSGFPECGKFFLNTEGVAVISLLLLNLMKV